MGIPSQSEITRQSVKAWLLLAFVISFVDIHSAYAIWHAQGQPDFWFRPGSGIRTTALLTFFGTSWWMIVILVVFGFLIRVRLSPSHLSVRRFAAIVVLASAALTAFHLYEFHVGRPIWNGSSSGIVVLSVVLVEAVNRIMTIRRSQGQTQEPVPVSPPA